MFFSLFRQRERTKRDHVARFESEGISTLRTELRDSLRSNRSSLHLKVPFSVVAFLCCLSRYNNIFNDNGNVNVNWLLFQQHYPALGPPLSRGSKPTRRSYIMGFTHENRLRLSNKQACCIRLARFFL